MVRKSLLMSLVAVLACVHPADAQSKGKAKAKKKGDVKVLKEGDEVVVTILGDEQARYPKIAQAGVVTPEALTLPVYRQISASSTDPDHYFDRQTRDRFNEAALAGDKV